MPQIGSFLASDLALALGTTRGATQVSARERAMAAGERAYQQGRSPEAEKQFAHPSRWRKPSALKIHVWPPAST